MLACRRVWLVCERLTRHQILLRAFGLPLDSYAASWISVSIIMKKILVLVLLFLVSSKTFADCSFKSKMDSYKPENAATLAEKAFQVNNIYFIAVADGVGPSRPGFDIPLTSCIYKNTKWDMLWVGADSQYCASHEALIARAKRYAQNFNKTMVRLASSKLHELCPELSKQ